MHDVNSDKVIPSLPSPVSGDGLFTPIHSVPVGSFHTDPLDSSTSYSNYVMNPASIIGSVDAPYMPVALPEYITTLYTNVFNINSNLQNDIENAAAIDDRQYPTSYAVQKYVQQQVAGTEILGLTSSGNDNGYFVHTLYTNTIVQEVSLNATQFQYQNNQTNTYHKIAIYCMDTAVNQPRNGASKTVMFAAKHYLIDSDGVPTGNLAFLYSGDNSSFHNKGNHYKFYQFVNSGDFLDFVQLYNETDSETNGWDWLVKDFGGLFTNTILVGPTNARYNIIRDASPSSHPDNFAPIGLTLSN
jgi:hypothetical protein